MPIKPAAAAVLAAHGCVPDPAGWRFVDLVDLAAAAGLWAVVEPVEQPTAGQRYRALVFRPSDPRAGGDHATRAARKRGATEEEALAAALASLLGHAGAGR